MCLACTHTTLTVYGIGRCITAPRSVKPLTGRMGTATNALLCKVRAQPKRKTTPKRFAYLGGGERSQGAQFSKSMIPKELRQGAIFADSPDGVNENLLLLLHGLGDKPAPYANLAKKMKLPQTATLAISGPLEIPMTDGGRAWYTTFDDDFELIQGVRGERRRLQSLEPTIALLQQLLQVLHEQGGWPYKRIHLFGFSQGGTVVLELVRRYSCPQVLGGAVAVSASLFSEVLLDSAGLQISESSEAKSSGGPGGGSTDSIPVLITHGNQDKVLERRWVEQTRDGLNALGGLEVTAQYFNKGHAMVAQEDEMSALMTFWARTLGSKLALADNEEVVEVNGGMQSIAQTGVTMPSEMA
ncbi:hypothetical protein CYMTET_8924 [Cymbomonas tetramitiformis]|uniref:Phospholipase/carboxylesterase/thioesterase domain-containing protein n=1 Tax=Cymbomonas tetramitiformis TaxID=36881 RepID=A0AAE0GSP8_9CHLO|nr:hypothetical protein CYMTET_8924 [Cymbomonas tetramitiformis]